MRQIKGVKDSRDLYATLIYSSAKDYKWVICSNQIKNFPLTVQDVDVAKKFWEKDISALKGKTNCSKMNIVTRDQVEIPVDLTKLQKEVFLI